MGRMTLVSVDKLAVRDLASSHPPLKFVASLGEAVASLFFPFFFYLALQMQPLAWR